MHNILLFQDPLSNKFNKYGGLQYSSAFTRDSERRSWGWPIASCRIHITKVN